MIGVCQCIQRNAYAFSCDHSLFYLFLSLCGALKSVAFLNLKSNDCTCPCNSIYSCIYLEISVFVFIFFTITNPRLKICSACLCLQQIVNHHRSVSINLIKSQTSTSIYLHKVRINNDANNFVFLKK